MKAAIQFHGLHFTYLLIRGNPSVKSKVSILFDFGHCPSGGEDMWATA